MIELGVEKKYDTASFDTGVNFPSKPSAHEVNYCKSKDECGPSHWSQEEPRQCCPCFYGTNAEGCLLTN